MKSIAVVALSYFVFAMPASANSLTEKLADCQAIENAEEKLSCYENVAALSAATVAEPAIEAPSGDATNGSSVEVTEVAARRKPIARPKPIETTQPSRYEARISRAEYTPTGKLIVQLSNGEIWQQTSRGGFRLPPAGSGVRIRKSFSGAWFLKFDHDGRESRMKLKKYGG